MDEISEEDPGPSAPDSLTWNPSDAMLEKAKGATRAYTDQHKLITVEIIQKNLLYYCDMSS